MKTFNSIGETTLLGKINARIPEVFVANNVSVKMAYVIDTKRHSETNIFLDAIRAEYMPGELVHIIRGLHSYAYDNGMTEITPPRLSARAESDMGTWYLTFTESVDDYLADTLPSESDDYWENLSRMAAHALIVAGRMRSLAVV